VQVGAPPEDGKANAELREALVGPLGLTLDCVVLYSGHKSRDKVIAFRGIEEGALREGLLRLLSRPTG
jgi:uncharacterized protein YggU (UPF0235/DUF167 family)